MAVMTLLRSSTVLLRQEIVSSPAAFECSGAVSEEDWFEFRVDEPEDGLTYRISIGDLEPKESVGKRFAGQIWWGEEMHFESGRGHVIVSLFSRKQNADDSWQRRLTIRVTVVPTKLGESRYEAMIESLRAVSVGLVFDLLSKSSVFLGSRTAGKISTRPPSSELSFLSRSWERLTRAIRELSSQPQMRVATSRVVDIPLRTAMIGREELNVIVRKGFDPRRRMYSRGISVRRHLSEESIDTPEHHTIVALIHLLYLRVVDCEKRAFAQAELLRCERPMRDFQIKGKNLYLDSDIPKLERLQNAITQANMIQEQMRLALASPIFRGLGPRLGSLNTPVFNHVVPYRRFRDESLGYFQSTVAILDEGIEERSKATHRMYEQWVFLQVLAALRDVGLTPMFQKSLLSRTFHQRFTIDLERNTQVGFLARDGRSVRVRYEPWVRSKTMAEAEHESVYKGKGGEVPWAPDLLIEVFSAGQHEERQPEYAIVLDAKYSRSISDDQKSGVKKYDDIRGIENDRPVVKQVWIVHPGDAGVLPWDDAVTWTSTGPDRPLNENVYGTLCASPPDELDSDRSHETNEELLEFIRSLGLYLQLISPDPV